LLNPKVSDGIIYIIDIKFVFLSLTVACGTSEFNENYEKLKNL